MTGVYHDPHAFTVGAVAVATAYPDSDEEGGPYHAIAWQNEEGRRFHMLLDNDQAETIVRGLTLSLLELAT